MSMNIHFSGVERVQAKLAALKNPSKFRHAVQAGLLHLKGKMAKYPAAGSGNQETGFPGCWYERGYGPKWARQDGSVGGSKTSETLSKRWSTKVFGSMRGVLSNDTSYGPFVQSQKDQAVFHQQAGWVTDADVIKSEKKTILGMLRQTVREILKKG